MSDFLKEARWIWCNDHPLADEYGEFVETFSYNGGSALLNISADSNYAVYLNGELIAFGQYADFPYDKVYDSIDITAHCHKGKNRLGIMVWYYGISDSQVYYPGKAALLYAITEDGALRCQSGENTLCRMSRAYVNHRCKKITNQIGWSFAYDAAKQDDWLTGELNGFTAAVLVEQELPLRVRPCKRLELLAPVKGKECIRLSDTRVVYDLGEEEVGFLQLAFDSPREQKLLIAYGEHIDDGCVRQKIGDRDFSVEYRATVGRNQYFNPFRRLGCRYLEIQCERPIELEEIALRPTMYPVAASARPELNEKQNRIYDMCARTLQLCMHEHYEDCPWREQALYAMDSRNQMLCGYYAFGETQFPRANLQLISKDNRADGLLAICFPISMDFVIPSFSLHYITACREYLEHSNDTEFLEEIFPKLQSVLNTFLMRLDKNGLVKPFDDTKRYWNFYEWREGLDGLGDSACRHQPDLILNALLSLQLKNMVAICERLGKENDYQALADKLNEAICRMFRGKDGLFYDLPSHTQRSELGNALSVLCEAVVGEDAAYVCEFLSSNEPRIKATLSMRSFKYDALLKTDKRYAEFVLKDIDRAYTPMIEHGCTTVWETDDGGEDFEKAGSLCHGWSAIPLYYFHTLLK